MERRPLSTQAIRVLIALADEGSFTAAAERLEITQSAVSRMVAQIEDSLGVTLFDRSRNGAKPREALTTVLSALRRIDRDLERVAEMLDAREPNLRGVVRVAGFRSATSILLPPAVSGFMATHHDVRVSLVTVREQGGGVQQLVEEGRADFGLTTLKPSRRLRSVHLGCDSYVLVRRRRKTRAPSRADRHLILWNERCSEPVPAILDYQGWTVQTRMDVDSDTAVLGMVAQGTGITIMPELATEPLPDGLERVPLRGDFKRHIWLCGLPTTWESKSAMTLASYIKKAVRRRLAPGT